MKELKKLLLLAALFLLTCSRASAAIARDVAVCSNSASGLSLNITCAPASGTLVLVWILYAPGSSQTITSCTDGGDTYLFAFNAAASLNGNYTLALCYTWNARSGITTITVNVPVSAQISAIAESYTGVQTSSDPIDGVSTVATGTGTTETSNSITTTVTGMVVGLVADNTNNVAYAATSPNNLVANQADSPNGAELAASDRLNIAAGTYSVAFTNAAPNKDWNCFAAGFKAAGAARVSTLPVMGCCTL